MTKSKHRAAVAATLQKEQNATEAYQANEREINEFEQELEETAALRTEYFRAKAAGEPLDSALPSRDLIDEFEQEIKWRIEKRPSLANEVRAARSEKLAAKNASDQFDHFLSEAKHDLHLENEFMPAWEDFGDKLKHQMALFYVTNYVNVDKRRKEPPRRNTVVDTFGPAAHFVEHLRSLQWNIWPFSMRPSWLPKNPAHSAIYEPIAGTWAAVEEIKQEIAE